MSDEQETKDNGAEWTMPEPVFRSSEGRTPKAAKSHVHADEIDTESPDLDESDADDIDTEIPNLTESDADDIDTEIPNLEVSEGVEEAADTPDVDHTSTVRAFPESRPKPKGGCAKSVVVIIGAILFFTLAVIAAAVYILFYSKPPETGTF